VSADVAEMSLFARPPKASENLPVQFSRLMDAHENVLHDTITRLLRKPIRRGNTTAATRCAWHNSFSFSSEHGTLNCYISIDNMTVFCLSMQVFQRAEQ
jgi:hypothetical protein